jgi:hypothetical protein
VQLVIEYDPQPPFTSGSPEQAGGSVAEDIRARRKPLLAAARRAAERAKERLGT